MSQPIPVLYHYRAGKCRKCGVKFGMGNCDECLRLAEAMEAMVEAVSKQFGGIPDEQTRHTGNT
jgi:hypothetical protein